MRLANPSSIVSDQQFSAFRWDTLRARRTSVQPARRYWRGRGVGGSSAINGQIAIRGVVEDYDEWAALTGDDRWNWENVLPVFKRHEDNFRGAGEHHGAGGELRVEPDVFELLNVEVGDRVLAVAR